MKKKSNSVTPGKGMRFYFPHDFEQETEFQRYIIQHKEFNWSDYLKIRVPEENLIMRIYIPHFAVIFGRNEIKLHVTGKEEPVMLSTRPLLNKFQEGYIRGLKYFEENFKVSAEILYGPNWQMYERTLHRHYYHPAEGSVVGDWVRYERLYPIVFDFEELFQYGYYSALISCVKDLQKRHPIVFENFAICKKEKEHEKETTLVHTDPLIEKIISHLKPLSGYWMKEKIMSSTDYNQLIEYVVYLERNNKLPSIPKKFKKSIISNQFILKTFYRLHGALHGRRRNKLYYSFIKAAFIQFSENTTTSIGKNFSKYVGNYASDLSLITYDELKTE